MEISREQSVDLVILTLRGRLDANWSGHVETALSEVVRSGEHRLHLDMSGVDYLSSAGVRVLLSCFKQLRAINGLFGVVSPSEPVRSVLDLSGLGMLIATAIAPGNLEEDGASSLESGNARHRVFALGGEGMRVELVGEASLLQTGVIGDPQPLRRFGGEHFAIGVGALGGADSAQMTRAGEFLASAGVAAFQPADGSSRADFLVSEGALVPEGRLLLGLCAEGSFSSLVRFEAKEASRTVGMCELATTALNESGAEAALFVAVTETSGLVGASLRQSPAISDAGGDPRFAFPGIRDWLSFTSERAHRDSTSLIVGFVARQGTALEPLLRPIHRDSDLLGHFHAAAFPYRPLRKGRIELKPLVNELFEGHSLQAVLHLLSDPRGINGAGESEFFRGALWVAPVLF